MTVIQRLARRIRSLFGPRAASPQNHRRVSLEALEDRCLLSADGWTQRGGNAGHTSYVETSFDPTALGHVWTAPLNYHVNGGESYQLAVAIDGERVYRTVLEGYSFDGTYHVIAYDLNSGSEVWHHRITGYAHAGVGEPSIASDVVFVNRAGHSDISGGSEDQFPRLYGFDAETGTRVIERTYSAQWGYNDRPVIDGDQLVVEDGYYDGMTLYSIRSSPPVLDDVWSVPRPSGIDDPMAALDDEYVYAFGNRVYRRSDGTPLSSISHPLGISGITSPMVSDSGRVLFSVYGFVNGRHISGVSAYDADTHQHLWTTQTSALVVAKAVGNGVVAVAAGRDVLFLDETTGAELRRWQASGNLVGEIVLTRNHVFVQSVSPFFYDVSTVHAIELATGREVWAFRNTRSLSDSTPIMEMALSGDYLLLSHNRFVKAFRVGANVAPVAADDRAATSAIIDILIPVLANDRDGNGDALTVTILTPPTKGSVAAQPDGTVLYTPDAGSVGTDRFTYRASDGYLDSDVATVTLTISPPDTAPVAEEQLYSLDEDATLNGRLQAIDAENDPVTYEIAYAPTSGTLTAFDGSTGEFTYRPGPNFAGTDSFSFWAYDGQWYSFLTTVLITVQPVNDSPTLRPAAFRVAENSALGTTVGTVSGSDVDGDTLFYHIRSGNESGAFVIDQNTGRITVAGPVALDYEWTRVFKLEVTVRDTTGLVGTARVTVNLSDVAERRQVAIDILPAGRKNPISLRAWNPVEVAILSSGDFDARTVYLSSLRFGRTGRETSLARPPRYRFRDVNRDGRLDLVVLFDARRTGLRPGDTAAILTGRLQDGTAIRASAPVSVKSLGGGF